jgi:hypothetical protein
MIGRQGSLLCLDLMAEEVTGIEVSHGQVTHWFTHELLPGSIAGGVPTDAKRLAAQLRTSLDTAGISARRVRVAISDAALLTRIVQLPRMPRRELRRAASYAAERELPIPAAERVWSWMRIPVSDGPPAILVMACWRDALDRVQAAMQSAGLETEFIEPRSAALSRSIASERALVLELSGGTVRATGIAQGQVPTTMQAKAPAEEKGWGSVIEPLVLSARRQLGKSGRDLPVLITQGLETAIPEALGARPVAGALALRNLRVTRELPAQRYLVPLGLALGGRDNVTLKAKALPARRRPVEARAVLRRASKRWVPGLAVVSLVSWSTVAVGTAVLLGWHPSWPLAP